MRMAPSASSIRADTTVGQSSRRTARSPPPPGTSRPRSPTAGTSTARCSRPRAARSLISRADSTYTAIASPSVEHDGQQHRPRARRRDPQEERDPERQARTTRHGRTRRSGSRAWRGRPRETPAIGSARRRGSTSRRVTPRITAANGVPHISQTSRKIGLRAPQTLHGQNGSVSTGASAVATASSVRPRHDADRRRRAQARSRTSAGHGGRGRRAQIREALAAPIRVGADQGLAVGDTGVRHRSRPAGYPRLPPGERSEASAQDAGRPSAASGSHPASRAAISGHVWSTQDALTPGGPHGRARSGSASRSPTASATAATRAPVHEEPRLTVHEGFARPARIADHDGLAAGGGLDEDVPPALHLEPAQPRAARHREHVAGGVVPRQVVLGDLPGERDRPGRKIGGHRPQPILVRAAADDRERSVGHPFADRRHRADQHVLSLARHQPAHAHDERPIAHAERRADIGGLADRDGTARRRHPGTAPRPAPSAGPRSARFAR